MRRLNLFEFEDQPWLPSLLRDGMRAYLQWVAQATKAFDVTAPWINRALENAKAQQILDLGSGSGGPWQSLRHLVQAQAIELSDLHPDLGCQAQVSAWQDPKIRYRPEPLNALAHKQAGPLLRTLFNAFHHLSEEQALALLLDCQSQGHALAIFDGNPRRVLGLLSVLPAPLLALFSQPFWRPFRWGHFLFTYLIPLLPLLILLDGLLSQLRMYGPRELEDLIFQLPSNEGYHWEVGTLPVGPLSTTYLIGWPKIPVDG